MTETWWLVLALAAGTFGIRLAGIMLGRRIPDRGSWARGLRALPGCLVISLVSVSVLSGGPRELAAAMIAAAVAVASRNLPVTMASGIAAIWLLRHIG